MTVLYSITKDAEFEGLTAIFGSGETYPVSSDHPQFTEIRDFLIHKNNDDEKLLDLISPYDAVFRKLYRLSDRISRKHFQFFLDGDPIDNSISKFAVEAIDREGLKNEAAWRPFVNLLEKLATNPSVASQEHLGHYISSNGITIFPDGDLLLWKGTQGDGHSINAGYGIVDGVEFGAVNEEGRVTKSVNLLNEVGSVISIPRSLVDTNRNVHCSTGLHAGTYGYASGFATRLVQVKVNPRDVVSVPDDYNNAKVRVCRYEVFAETRDDYTDVIYSAEAVAAKAKAKADAAKKAKKAKKSKKTAAVTATSDEKVEQFKALITGTLIPDGITNFNSYRSKRVTAGQRDNFRRAQQELGLL